MEVVADGQYPHREATKDGLLLGTNRYGRCVWGHGHKIVSLFEPVDEPLLLKPDRHFGVRELCDGEPEAPDAIFVPGGMSVDAATEYVITAIEHITHNDRSAAGALQFERCYGCKTCNLGAVKAETVDEVLYPFWIAKYTHAGVDRYLALAGTRKSQFDRIDISEVVLANEGLAEGLADD